MPTVPLADILRPENFIWDLPSRDKPTVLEALARAVATREASLDEATVLDLLEQREAVLSTGIGEGVALPHAMVPGLDHKLLLVCRVDPPVDYAAIDDVPVDLLFLLLSASEKMKDHIRVLARLARIIGRAPVLDQLRAARDADDAYRILLEEDARRV